MINCRVIENATPEYVKKYEEFVKLYNNPDIRVADIREQLGLNIKQYTLARKQALSEGLIKDRISVSKNKKVGRPKLKKKKHKHYSHSRSGKFNVVKRFCEKGEEVNVYCGTYDSEEQAMMVAEEMDKVGWDKKYLNKIREKVFECTKR